MIDPKEEWLMLKNKRVAKTTIMKRAKVCKVSEIMCFYFRRLTVVDGYLKKIDKNIKLPPSMLWHGRTYNLNAVICHLGNENYGINPFKSIKIGHYVTLRRLWRKKLGCEEKPKYKYASWYLVSDSVVRQVSKALPTDCEAYMAFYQ